MEKIVFGDLRHEANREGRYQDEYSGNGRATSTFLEPVQKKHGEYNSSGNRQSHQAFYHSSV